MGKWVGTDLPAKTLVTVSRLARARGVTVSDVIAAYVADGLCHEGHVMCAKCRNERRRERAKMKKEPADGR